MTTTASTHISPARIVLAPTWDLAQTVIAQVTVEAEYGGHVREGTVYTAAHHQPSGPFAGRHVVEGGRPAPCNDADIPVLEEGGMILLSHIDLDSVGGALRAQGRNGLFSEQYASFWALAEFVDTNGAHKLGKSGASEGDLRRLYAWWAYSKGLPRHPRDVVTDITADIGAASDALARILAGDDEALAAGDKFLSDTLADNHRTFVGIDAAGVIFRTTDRANDFVNAGYTTPDGHAGKAVLGYNTANGSVTISLADPIEGVSCRELVQRLWGTEAGGHAGIAGSPRGQQMAMDDARTCAFEMANLITNAVEAQHAR